MGYRYIAVEDACAEVDKGDLLVGNNAEWAKEIICRTPAADVVGKSVYEQIKWERDIAMEQLQDAGIPFGGKADVVVARHGEWIEASSKPYAACGKKCSLCGARIRYSEFGHGNHNYCHKCGAKMDGGNK